MALYIGLFSKSHRPGSVSIDILYSSLQLMERGAVERFINNNKKTAVLRGISDNARQAAVQLAAEAAAKAASKGLHVDNRPFTPMATLSYYEKVYYYVDGIQKEKDIIHHVILRLEDSKYIAEVKRYIWYTDNLSGFEHITNIIADISSGGKRRKRNTYKKRNRRRRKTQYRRR
jgi:hypothetical protein